MGKYTAVGNTTAPGDLRFTPNGKAVCNFTVAETTRRFDKQANEWVDDSTTFWRCTVWGKPAEHVAESLADKGVRVVVAGDVKTRTWDDKEGNKRSSTELDNCEVGLSTLYNPVAPNRGGGSQPRSAQPGGFDRSGFQGGQPAGGFGGGQQGFGGPSQPPVWEQDDNTPPF